MMSALSDFVRCFSLRPAAPVTMESSPQPNVLDARVHAWRESFRLAGCQLRVTPLKEYPSSTTASATCASVDLSVRASGDNLDAVGMKLGEALRLLHAATARPLRTPQYDWLQQLLWPNICTLAQCRCCHDGDRRLTLKISCPRKEFAPQPQGTSSSLVEWIEDEASPEYKDLIAAIQLDVGGVNPEAPLAVVVEVLPLVSRMSDPAVFMERTKDLVQILSETSTPWLRVEAIAASFRRKVFDVLYGDAFKILATSKLPLALPAFSPITNQYNSMSSMHEWLFRHSCPSNLPLVKMPVIVDLRIQSVGSPTPQIFTEFCAWLGSNDSLKILVIEMPTHLSSSSPEMWESFGFALFSPFSKLNLDHLELDIQGIADSDIVNMVAGSQRVHDKGNECPHPRGSPHRQLKLRSSRASTTTRKFIQCFGHAIHELDISVDEIAFPLLLQTVLESSAELRELKVGVFKAPSHRRITSEEAASIWPATPSTLLKLRALTIVDDTGTRASPVVRQTLELTGHALSYLSISDHSATDALADAILQSCPMLDALAVDRTEASFWERLSDGYSRGACKISDLTLWDEARAPSPWVIDLVRTLTNPASLFTTTLKKLKLRGEFYSADAQGELQRVGLEMLDHNPFLIQLVLPLDFKQREGMLAQHGEVIAKATHPLPPRQRLALLSCSLSLVDGRMPPDLWHLILDFSAHPVRRTVAACHLTSRRARG